MNHLWYSEKDGIFIVIMDEPALFDDATVLRKRQDIDALVEEHDVRKLLLDFAQVNLTGSAALGMLVRLKGKLAKRGCALKLCRIQPTVAETFRITSLDTIFDIYDDLDQAAEAFG